MSVHKRLQHFEVGAGLPVVGPLQALLRAGDEVDTVAVLGPPASAFG